KERLHNSGWIAEETAFSRGGQERYRVVATRGDWHVSGKGTDRASAWRAALKRAEAAEQPWSAEQDELLRTLPPDGPARRTGRRRHAVSARRRELRVPDGRAGGKGQDERAGCAGLDRERPPAGKKKSRRSRKKRP